MADADDPDRSPLINHPLYTPLLQLLNSQTLFPLTLVQFRDQFLPSHDVTGVASTYMQFHQWYSTFRGYFASLAEDQRIKCPPPKDLKPQAAMMVDGNGQSKLNVTTVAQAAYLGGGDPLPYRTEVDCALAHYLPAGKFPSDMRTSVLNDARQTTHPDVFLPLVHYLHEQLLAPFEVFYKLAANNISPVSKRLRLLVTGMALLMGIAVLVFCQVMDVQWWWSLIPLPWMSVAAFYFWAAVWGLDPMRYWFGLTFVNILGMWISDGSDEEKGVVGLTRVAVVMDEHVKREQTRRMRWVYLLSAVCTIVFWCAGLLIP